MTILNLFSNKIFNISIFLLAFLVFISSPSYAKIDTIYGSYKYVMGDNDTKNEAKRICFIEARRRALEKAGVYIQSITEINNYQLTKDEIKTYAAAILKTDVVKEEIIFEGESITIHTTVKVNVDDSVVLRKMEQIKSDTSLSMKINQQQKKIQELENKVKSLQKKKDNLDITNTTKIRKQQYEAFGQLDELEKIKFNIKMKTHLAIDNVELGMTPDEVKRIIGDPRSTQKRSSIIHYNYGKVWLIFEGGIVACIINTKGYYITRSCQDYRGKVNLKKYVIK